MNTCKECKFCLSQDTGYSNYTVMGTDFYCLKNPEHKDNGEDFWGLELKACDQFSCGYGIELDVDGQYEPDKNEFCDEVWNLYKIWLKD